MAVASAAASRFSRSHRSSSSRSTHAQHRPTLIRAKLCLPAFVLSCVAVNLALVLLWLSKEQSHDLERNAGSRFFAMTGLSSPNGKPQDDDDDRAIVGHVVSLIKCSKVASVTGFLDAAAVLQHSIHIQSLQSRYDYQMYAIVHIDCQAHAPLLERLGYKTLVKESPVTLDEMPNGWYRDHVEGENCCGSKEFIKLYAYQLDHHPIVVHWDLDVALLQPMDDLFDSMLFPPSSVKGRTARGNLDVAFPKEPLPQTIDAFFTRDVTSSVPWEPRQVVQGGFLVAKPNRTLFDVYANVIKTANYTRGRGGWANLGHGSYQGSMAYQGIVAYVYDALVPGTAVELNACRWNQVVADVAWRGPQRKDEFHGKCRQLQQQALTKDGACLEDCRVTPFDLVKSVHYTACKKPWECTLPHPRKTNNPAQQYRVNHLTNITTCGLLFRKWFAYRRDLEELLSKRAGILPANASGSYEPNSFLGYCKARGQYIAMNLPTTDFDISKLYKDETNNDQK